MKTVGPFCFHALMSFDKLLLSPMTAGGLLSELFQVTEIWHQTQ